MLSFPASSLQACSTLCLFSPAPTLPVITLLHGYCSLIYPNPFTQSQQGLQSYSKKPIRACFKTSILFSLNRILLPTSKITLLSSLLCRQSKQTRPSPKDQGPPSVHNLLCNSTPGHFCLDKLSVWCRTSPHSPKQIAGLHGLTPSHRPFHLPEIPDLFNCQILPHPF